MELPCCQIIEGNDEIRLAELDGALQGTLGGKGSAGINAIKAVDEVQGMIGRADGGDTRAEVAEPHGEASRKRPSRGGCEQNRRRA
jgi:hypothetical protein